MPSKKIIKKEKKLTPEQKARIVFAEEYRAKLNRVVKYLPKGLKIKTIEPFESRITMTDLPSRFVKGKFITEAGLLSTYIFLVNRGMIGEEQYLQIDTVSKLYDNPEFAKCMADLGAEAVKLKLKINVQEHESKQNESENE